MTQEEIKEGNRIIALYMGWVYYPVCKIATYYYESEISDWNEMDTDDIWVLEPTELFNETPCVSNWYWKAERELEKRWKDCRYSLHYQECWDDLIPVVKRLLAEHRDGWESPYAAQMIKDSIRETLSILEIESLWNATVKGINVMYREKAL